MRSLLYLSVFVALFLGLNVCSPYYYSMLSSNDPVGEKNERGNFVWENDMVCISYRFWGENAPVTIIIYSKLDEPLYVDWGRSALIIDDVVITYDPKVASVRSESPSMTSGSFFHWSDRSSNGWSYSEGPLSGDVSLSKGAEFISPYFKLANTPLQLANLPFNEIPKEEHVKEQMTTKANTIVDIRMKDFMEENSPLRFHNYLMLFTGGINEKLLKHPSFERNFYLTKLIKVGDVALQYFDEGQQQSDDSFYAREIHGATTGLVVGVIAVAAVGVAIEATPGSMDY